MNAKEMFRKGFGREMKVFGNGPIRRKKNAGI